MKWIPIMDGLPKNDREVLCTLRGYPAPVVGYFLDGTWVTDIPNGEVISWTELPERYRDPNLEFRTAWEAFHIATVLDRCEANSLRSMFYHVRGRIYDAATDGLFEVEIGFPPREDIIEKLRESGYTVVVNEDSYTINWEMPTPQPRISD